VLRATERSAESCGSLTIREGKAFTGFDENHCERRVELYLARGSRDKRRAWRVGANTLVSVQLPGRPGLTIMGSSDEVHVMDALAITGDEGRGSLRKAAGSRQTGFDPQMSEWGNPAHR
jgi:hypothetical protein